MTGVTGERSWLAYYILDDNNHLLQGSPFSEYTFGAQIYLLLQRDLSTKFLPKFPCDWFSNHFPSKSLTIHQILEVSTYITFWQYSQPSNPSSNYYHGYFSNKNLCRHNPIFLLLLKWLRIKWYLYYRRETGEGKQILAFDMRQLTSEIFSYSYL